MTADDVDAVAVIRTRGWQAAYAGLIPQAYLDGLNPAEDAERRRALFAAAPPEVVDLVAERDGGLVGWAAFGPARGQDEGPRRPPGGELYALYLSPEHIGTGIGHALMDACLLRAAQQGFPEVDGTPTLRTPPSPPAPPAPPAAPARPLPPRPAVGDRGPR
ncbi:MULTISPECIES: GNAT family N-acetyltransferase [Streptomyces]|uniref:GNAT family N-acetyltransferase n=2 Tax=Streptomyces rimosus subsp. rimosus TaxID=132474 RepID=L8ETA3_STRR1|nr:MULTISPECIES: GNAT family N-acetyltransferase [Streptomyces]MYT43296.1 GNAT family N-acetyltransferase [Streptomyces sp. SID5471]KOT30872.1 hypothetical protein ADK84_30865 [Streptomyces sp. NRRL WC-3701]KOT50470.1 hypothetical protein ADK44_34670 [Streptomyces rimosus subsp. rimosus]KOT57637.1 hypothetical protein ADK45_24645 [Streptomyces rimosus subsp. rimosus]KOT71461.1 hypothetical protein ADK47_31380 [Streptomyces rimosus subsp. rimosus]